MFISGKKLVIAIVLINNKGRACSLSAIRNW